MSSGGYADIYKGCILVDGLLFEIAVKRLRVHILTDIEFTKVCFLKTIYTD